VPPPSERRWPGIVAGYVALTGLVGLAGTPAYYYAEPAMKPLVVRLAVGVLLSVALLQVGREVRARLRQKAASPFERARRPRQPEPELAPRFLRLRDELALSQASQGYFEHILWLRLLALAPHRPGAAAPETPPRPAWRRLLRRGPSLAALRTLIPRIEEPS
jgi:hypothetical protein